MSEEPADSDHSGTLSEPPVDLNEDRSSQLGSLQVVLAVVALLTMLLFRLGGSVVDPDVWHEMALIRKAAELGRIPYRDHFSYMPTVVPSVQHEWGAGVILYGLANGFGGNSLLVLRFALVLGTVGLTWWNARQQGGSWSAIVLLSVLAIQLMGDGFATVRAQMYSFLFLSVIVCFCHIDRQGKRWWIVPWLLIFVLWLNLHAGFLVGAGLFFFYWLEQFLRKQPHRHLLWTGIAMFPLGLINPYHWHYFRYLPDAVLLDRTYVAEWNSLWEQNDQVLLSLYLLSIAILLYTLWQSGFKQCRGWPQIVIAALAAASAVRMLPIFAIVWLAYVPGYLTRTRAGEFLDSFWRNNRPFHLVFWPVCAVFFGMSLRPAEPWRLQVPGVQVPALGKHTVYPVGAMHYLKEQKFHGNLMVGFDWGAYIQWKLAPEVKVSMDGRYEVAYPPEQTNENVEFFMAEPGWQEMLEREYYRETDLILVPTFLPLAKEIGTLEGWKRVYRDPSFEIYAREGSTLPYVLRETVVRNGGFP